MPRMCPSCTTAYFDVFALVANPDDHYWNLVEGGGGRILDPVGAPGALPADGATWFWGGQLPMGGRAAEGRAGEGPRIFTRPIGIVAETDGRPVYLSLCLDTATDPDADGDFASWGFIERLRVVPELGDGTVLDPVLPDWVVSDEDPDGGTEWSHVGDGTSVAIGGPLPDGASTQVPGIRGIGALLPVTDPGSGQSIARYQISMDPDFATWDLYDAVTPPVRASELSPVTVLALFAVLAVTGGWWLRRG